jgi:hypothetical protein
MTKEEFKKKYSEYRKALKVAYRFGKESYIKALYSSKLFNEIYSKEVRPVSIKCYLSLPVRGV